ncbi:MAG: hypothetical protein ACRBF0_09135 [Calditrichia bacterium]
MGLLVTIFASLFLLPVNAQQDSLTVVIENISLEADTVLNVQANFPYPIFMFVSVQDTGSNHVPGLASDTAWIPVDGIAQNGRPVVDNWPSLREYFQADPGFPTNSNIYNQRPSPMFTEVADSSGPVIRKFYLIAYLSPAPCGDETVNGDSTRVIDIQVNDGIRDGSALASYIYRGPPRYYDMDATKSASVDTASAGQIFQYSIDVTNTGVSKAFTLTIVDSLPTLITATNYSQPPDSIVGELAYWNYDSLSPGRTISLTYTAEIDSPLAGGINSIASSARIVAICDTLLNNNISIKELVIVPPPPIDLPNLTVSQTVLTDSFAVDVLGDTTWYADEAETYLYAIRVSNSSTSTATDVVVRDAVPDSVSGTGFGSGDTLVWNLGDLPGLSDTTLTFQATVVNSVPFNNFPLVNMVTAESSNEPADSLADNSSATTVLALRNGGVGTGDSTDIAVFQRVRTDSFLVDAGDTTWYALESETYDYFLTIRNIGQFDALDVLLEDILPDSISGAGFNGSDTLRWDLGTLSALSDTTLAFEVTVTPTVPFNNYPLVNSARGSAANETAGSNGNNSSQSTVLVVRDGSTGGNLSDIAIKTTLQTDSLVTSGSDSIWFARRDEVYSYSIRIRNVSDVTAENVVVTDEIPQRVSIDPGFILPANGVLTGDSIRWNLGDLAPLEEVNLPFEVIVTSVLPPGITTHINRVVASASNEDPAQLSNNTAIDSVFTFVPQPLEACDFFTLDLNVFDPAQDQVLGINFELETSRNVKLDLLDISGYRVTNLYDETFDIGVNRREWNGRTLDGQPVGSGTYVVTLRSIEGRLICWRKVIIRR